MKGRQIARAARVWAGGRLLRQAERGARHVRSIYRTGIERIDRRRASAQAPKQLWPAIRGGVFLLVGTTFVVNVLVLIQPVYMLQMYDRVLASGSLETLAYISVIALAVLVLLGVLDAVRSVIAGRIAAHMDALLAGNAMRAAMSGPRAALGDIQPLRDLQTVRAFVSGRGVFAFLDLPFAPFFVAILALIHPHIFWLTVAGALALAAITFANQRASGRPADLSSRKQMSSMLMAQSFARNADSLNAMGMTRHALRAWGREETIAVNAQDDLNSVNAVFFGLSRSLRLGLQLAILGYGSYLVLAGQMTAGMIFAASLISGRGLQPIDQVIGGWKQIVEVRKAWTRVNEALAGAAVHTRVKTKLPRPSGNIAFEDVLVLAPGTSQPLLKRISFAVPAGAYVCVVGPSGAGKSTLIRALIGAIELRAGSVRIDGDEIDNWDAEQLGRDIGYLAQDVELLPGTIVQNIARFDPDASDAVVVEAAMKAGVHGLIQRMPNGYDTPLGPGAMQLSGGQRQRIGLARALYGNPRILVLDEPNAHLDGEGDLCLERALAAARQEGTTILIVTQRRAVSEAADRILIMREGAIFDYGPRDDVLRRQAYRVRPQQAAVAAADAGPSSIADARPAAAASEGRRA